MIKKKILIVDSDLEAWTQISVDLIGEGLLDSVWGSDFSGDTKTVDTHIKSLRSKHDPSSDYIKTV